MKIQLENIGVFKETEFELADLTVICGGNNTGKTYAAYSLFGFFDFWKHAYIIPIQQTITNQIYQDGSITIDLTSFINSANEILADASKKYIQHLPTILGVSKAHFNESKFNCSTDTNQLKVANEFSSKFGSPKDEMLQITKLHDSLLLSISYLSEKNAIDNPSLRININWAISEAIKTIIFGNLISDVFIASAERTGAAIFKNDLNIQQNRLIKEIAVKKELDLTNIIDTLYNSGYALPVMKSIDYIKNLDAVAKNESFLCREYPDIISDFKAIAAGEYYVDSNGFINYSPTDKKSIKLSVGECSSSVRSLLDIGFYLRCSAEKGDLLMIDEPELNLHPSNQVALAKVFVKLINAGIRVFITTHSDYIIKEFNSLIMLNATNDQENSRNVMAEFNYSNNELLQPDRIRVYISQKAQMKINGSTRKKSVQTLLPASIDSFYGIEANSFDETIDRMNKIQHSIMFGRKI